jgi:fermentation-respiration switch protein FrsA (DUF1100 family)
MGTSRRLKLLIALAAALALPSWVAVRAYLAERRCFLPNQHPPRLSLAEFAVQNAVAVTISGTEPLHGYYAPSRNGAAIVLTHGSTGERSDLAAEARILAAAGFGILAFDFPGHGESPGRVVTWSSNERAALSRAIDWLGRQPGVDGRRLGAFGFSMGGYIVTQQASLDERLRAVAIASAPSDPIDHLYWEYQRWGVLRQWPALLALRQSGMNTSDLVAERVIGRIAPRRVLLISGARDDLVPPWMEQRLFAAAAEPKQRLIVAGAGHGGYAESDPVQYPRALTEFFGSLLED